VKDFPGWLSVISVLAGENCSSVGYITVGPKLKCYPGKTF